MVFGEKHLIKTHKISPKYFNFRGVFFTMSFLRKANGSIYSIEKIKVDSEWKQKSKPFELESIKYFPK